MSAPQSSSVNVKGTVVIDAVESVRMRRGEPVLEQVISSLDEPFRALFRSAIYPTAWYPFSGLTAFIAAGLRLSNEPESVLVQRSEEVVARQLRGIYRVFVKLGSPEFVIKRLSAVHKTYFSGVQVATRELRPGHAQVRYTGFGAEHRLVEYMLIGFYRKALTIGGARNLNVELTTPIGDDSPHCELTLRWRPSGGP